MKNKHILGIVFSLTLSTIASAATFYLENRTPKQMECSVGTVKEGTIDKVLHSEVSILPGKRLFVDTGVLANRIAFRVYRTGSVKGSTFEILLNARDKIKVERKFTINSF